MNLDLLATCHSRLAALIGPAAEPFNVVKIAEEHRRYWRPPQPRLILLAESHVYTLEAEAKCLVHHPVLPKGIPPEYVRLIYCLGYGENSLLDRPPLGKNTGTPQFWKLFKSCAAEDRSSTFHEIQSSRLKHTSTRVTNKLRVLQKLQEQGTWLLDASIAALYQQGTKPKPSLRHAIINDSWDMYIRNTIAVANPESILVIGLDVARVLQARLDELGIPWDAVPQPQARLSASEHSDIHLTYSTISREPKKILNLSHRWLRQSPPVPHAKSARA